MFELNETNIVYLAIALVFLLIVTLFAFRAQVRDLVNDQLTSVRRSEIKLLEVTHAMSAEIQLQPLLQKVMETVTEILDADRSTLFLHDPKTGELWSKVAEGENIKEIRFPSNIGIAGSVFTTGVTINIKEAYRDERFNKAIDKKTGYRTHSILSMQVRNKAGNPIGVVQALNKRNGPFTEIDEKRLHAFSAQASIAIENATLFNEVVTMKNYTEAMFESMRHSIITTDESGKIIKVNSHAKRLFDGSEKLIDVNIADFFTGDNTWLANSCHRVLATGEGDEAMDAQLVIETGGETETISVNLVTSPLMATRDHHIGTLMVIEDITDEKRVRTTMARYMSKEVADRLLKDEGQVLGGNLETATILFSDIRSFTDFSERNGPQETVKMLNAYFTTMYDEITKNSGILDKYIGDAMMAVFGVPHPKPMDADNALRAAVDMTRALSSFNAQRSAQGLEEIHTGIGLNTGEVVSGNIGSTKRMDFTVIGDGVNLAARLESATKTYGSPVLLSAYTVAALKEEHFLREVDSIRVKGKQEPVAIFQALDAFDEPTQAIYKSTEALHLEGMRLYQAQDWAAARARFEEVRKIHQEDAVASIYIKRCSHFESSPPAADWDGVWTMNTK